MDITGATPSTLTGFYYLPGDALLEFGSGHITAIAANSELSLTGASSRVALSSNTTISGTLSGLSQNHGTLALADGASLATTTALTNGGTLYLDFFYSGSDFSDDGGSTLTIGGVLTNSSQIDIGNSRTLAPTTVTAAGLSNTGTIALAGGSAQSILHSTAAAPATWTGTAALSGDALLEFASGGITRIASGASLSLGGSHSLVALSTTPTSDSALTGLATNAGNLTLEGSALTTTVALNTTGMLGLDTSGIGGGSLTVGGALTNSWHCRHRE